MLQIMLGKGTRRITLTFSIAFSYAIPTTSKIKAGLTLFTKDIHRQKGL